MLARLWWKEARTLWPLWAAVLAMALVVGGLYFRYDRPSIRGGDLPQALIAVTILYAFAVGSTAFAGEREGKTLAFLDTLPVGRRALWWGKASFAFLSLFALALTCSALALALSTLTRHLDPSAVGATSGSRFGAFGATPRVGSRVDETVTFLLAALTWSLFWSALRENVLSVAVLAMLSVASVELASSALGGTGLVLSALSYRLAFAGVALAASWAILTRAPRPGRPPAAPRTVTIAPPAARADAAVRRPWGPAFLALIWQTAREARSAGLTLVAAGGFGFVMLAFLLLAYSPPGSAGDAVAWFLLIAAALGLAAGVNVFGISNRQRDYRFLVHHGVRPGLVWLARVLVWAVPVAAFAWLLDRFGVTWMNGRLGRPMPSPGWLVVATGFAVGQLCGLTIRRPITAGAIGVLAMILLMPPLIALQLLRIVPGEGLALVPLALLLIGLAWSGDWMAERPGAGRWLRLGGLVGVAGALLFGGFVAYRSRSVPDIGNPFERTEAVPAVAAGEGAAAGYRRAAAACIPLPPSRGSVVDFTPVERVIADGWDPDARIVVGYWRSNAAAIDLARRAAARHGPGFSRPATITGFLNPALDALRRLVTLLALDARERQSRGDLAGEWEDIRAIGRMANHAAEGGGIIQRLVSRALAARRFQIGTSWAADARQTPALLRAALADADPRPPILEAVRVEAGIYDRAMDLPAEELAQAVSSSGRVPRSNLQVIADAGLYAPWERARARRLFRILFAQMAEVAALDPWARPAEVGNFGVPGSGFAWPPRVKRWFFPAAELERAIEGTPIVQLLQPATRTTLYAFDQEAVERRAFELILALRVWQLEHGGRYPLALRELVPSVLPALPIDPFSGKAFGYIPSQGQEIPRLGVDLGRADAKATQRPTRLGQWLLYSVGPDQKDDRAEKDMRADGYRSYGDFVFPLPAAQGPPEAP